MSNPAPRISIPVDLTNPGQFFACCGLFELADRFWPEAQAWFEIGELQSAFQISVAPAATLSALLERTRSIQFDIGQAAGDEDSDGNDEDKALLDPIVIESPVRMVLDWWSDKSIKPWAGSMKERSILHAMLKAIDPAHPDPLNDTKAVFDPSPPGTAAKRAKKLNKREPFYFDCRRGSNAHPLDSGFSPDVHHFSSCCFPVVEALCFVGLQRTRPTPTDVPNRSTYTTWTKSLPVNAIGPVTCGMVQIPGSLAFAFDNFFRTDQRKHKSYSRATRERSNNA